MLIPIGCNCMVADCLEMMGQKEKSLPFDFIGSQLDETIAILEKLHKHEHFDIDKFCQLCEAKNSIGFNFHHYKYCSQQHRTSLFKHKFTSLASTLQQENTFIYNNLAYKKNNNREYTNRSFKIFRRTSQLLLEINPKNKLLIISNTKIERVVLDDSVVMRSVNCTWESDGNTKREDVIKIIEDYLENPEKPATTAF